jgi:hypothetical protein
VLASLPSEVGAGPAGGSFGQSAFFCLLFWACKKVGGQWKNKDQGYQVSKVERPLFSEKLWDKIRHKGRPLRDLIVSENSKLSLAKYYTIKAKNPYLLQQKFCLSVHVSYTFG